jgi:hypothetical protein
LEGNYILLDIEYKSVKYTIGSVYGANTNDGINMYNGLKEDIVKLKNSNIILGGDWNCVWDKSRVEENWMFLTWQTYRQYSVPIKYMKFVIICL